MKLALCLTLVGRNWDVVPGFWAFYKREAYKLESLEYVHYNGEAVGEYHTLEKAAEGRNIV